MSTQFSRRMAFLLVWDIAVTFISYLLASILTGQLADVLETHEAYFIFGTAVVVNIVTYMLFRIYNDMWEYASIDEALRIAVAVGIGTLISGVVLWMLGHWVPIRVYFVAMFLMILLVGGGRMAFRIARTKKHTIMSTAPKSSLPRTLIVGAGETGSLVISRMTSSNPSMPGNPVAAVDDDPAKLGQRIHGVKVIGTSDDIPDIVERYGVTQIVVAVPSAEAEQRKRIYAICSQTNCKLKTLPDVRTLRADEATHALLREVDVADLLGRDEVLLDTRLISGYVSGRTILVTGGGGSIGSELCRQLAFFAPEKIIVFDMFENDAYLLRAELGRKFNDIDCIVEIGNICDMPRLTAIFEKYKPEVVFHAAAHKHVPLMEDCPVEAVRNNILGTLNVASAAAAHNVKRFIFISTDKAVNPTSVMGATKRVGELIIQSFAQKADTQTIFAAVRFGNVLGSNGSIIPLFKQQISEGGPVTVTHPDIERYFMTIPEAARLVIQAGGMADGGEVFVLDMGEPVKILDLANKLIALSGAGGEDSEIEVVFTGIRPGDKMYEELHGDGEEMLQTNVTGITISDGDPADCSELSEHIDALTKAVENEDDKAALESLSAAVPGFCHTQEKNEGK